GTPVAGIHIPQPILAKIVSYVAVEGISELKSWIRTGKEGKITMQSPETLAAFRLDRSYDFVRWCRPTSIYFNFFGMCLHAKNPYALYMKALHLAFIVGHLNEALIVLQPLQVVYQVAELAYNMLLTCAGTLKDEDLWILKKKYSFEEVSRNADKLMYHIYMMGPRRADTYRVRGILMILQIVGSTTMRWESIAVKNQLHKSLETSWQLDRNQRIFRSHKHLLSLT
ncbi:hypothetical protein CARUB_v10010837mg, partial [Capsella rubella]